METVSGVGVSPTSWFPQTHTKGMFRAFNSCFKSYSWFFLSCSSSRSINIPRDSPPSSPPSPAPPLYFFMDIMLYVQSETDEIGKEALFNFLIASYPSIMFISLVPASTYPTLVSISYNSLCRRTSIFQNLCGHSFPYNIVNITLSCPVAAYYRVSPVTSS